MPLLEMEESQVKRGRGRPKKTIRETIRKDLEVNELVECISNYVHNLNLLFENRLLKCQIIIYSVSFTSNFGLQYVVFLIAFMYKFVVLDSFFILCYIF